MGKKLYIIISTYRFLVIDPFCSVRSYMGACVMELWVVVILSTIHRVVVCSYRGGGRQLIFIYILIV